MHIRARDALNMAAAMLVEPIVGVIGVSGQKVPADALGLGAVPILEAVFAAMGDLSGGDTL
jgi:hypothetical protein